MRLVRLLLRQATRRNWPMMARIMTAISIWLSLAVIVPASSADPIRDYLQRDADKWFHWLLAASFVVALGVILEAPEATIALKRWVLLRWEKDVPEQNEKSMAIPASYIGLLLVIAGVAGEVIFEAKVSNADTSLRAHDSQILGEAQSGAAQAELDAANARKSTVQLGKDTQALKTESEIQRVVAAKANERAAKANATAENERIERLKLEAQVSPRRLTVDQEKEMGDSLKAFAGKTVGVATYSQDVEAILLAVQIESALGKANILVHDRIGTFGAIGLPLSLGVVVDANSSDKQLESALLDALSKVNLGIANVAVAFGQGSTMYMPALPAGSAGEDAFVFVGGKPIALPPEVKR